MDLALALVLDLVLQPLLTRAGIGSRSITGTGSGAESIAGCGPVAGC